MFKAQEVYPTFGSVTQTAMISSGDFVEQKFCFVQPVFNQMDAAIGMILLSNTVGASHAQL